MYNRIIVFRSGRLGDFIVCLPALAKLRKAFPQARITFLTITSTKSDVRRKTEVYAATKRSLPWVDLAIPTLIDDAIVVSSVYSIRAIMHVWRSIRGSSPDAAFILPFTWEKSRSIWRKRMFLRAAGIHCPIFCAGTDLGLDRVRHQTDSALAALSGSDLIQGGGRPEAEMDWLNPPRVDEEWSRTAMRRADGHRVIVVSPGGTYSHKRWPVDRFVDLCHAILADQQNFLILIGSSAEAAIAQEVASTLSGRFINFCGQTTLGQLAAILRRCDVFIGNDSGPGHLAAAMGCQTITIMSSVYPAGVWEPRGSAASLSVRHKVECENCRCETHCPLGTEACIRGISVSNVMAHLNQLLVHE